METDPREISVQLEYAALLGELARPMVHEFNNFLNTVLLQVALLEATAPPELRADIALLAKESKNVAKVIQEWHRLNRPVQPKAELLDMNESVREVLKNPLLKGISGAHVSVDLTSSALGVYATAFSLRQLFLLLVTGALKGSPKKGSSQTKIKVRTQKKQQQAVLTVSDSGPRLSAQAVAELFDPVQSQRSGLELAVAYTLAERMHGHLHGENLPDGGVAISFSLSLASA